MDVDDDALFVDKNIAQRHTPNPAPPPLSQSPRLELQNPDFDSEAIREGFTLTSASKLFDALRKSDGSSAILTSSPPSIDSNDSNDTNDTNDSRDSNDPTAVPDNANNETHANDERAHTDGAVSYGSDDAACATSPSSVAAASSSSSPPPTMHPPVNGTYRGMPHYPYHQYCYREHQRVTFISIRTPDTTNTGYSTAITTCLRTWIDG